jgi:hypothetical protein
MNDGELVTVVKESVADVEMQVPVERIVSRSRAIRRRRLALRSAAGAAALTAGAVAVATVMVPGARPGGHGTRAVLAGYVVTRVDHALSAAAPGEIAQMTVASGGEEIPGGPEVAGTAQKWSYGGQWRSVRNSPDGHPVYDQGSSATSGYTLVNYQTRTWARQPAIRLPSAPGPDPRGCEAVVDDLPLVFQPGLPGTGFGASSLVAATALRAAISCGALTMAGHQHVDGIEAIELISSPDNRISETIWVSPDTYLPVRVAVSQVHGRPGFRLRADITWLPPTAQNLAKLTVPIPAGFRQVSLTQAIQGRPHLQKTAGGPPPTS